MNQITHFGIEDVVHELETVGKEYRKARNHQHRDDMFVYDGYIMHVIERYVRDGPERDEMYKKWDYQKNKS